MTTVICNNRKCKPRINTLGHTVTSNYDPFQVQMTVIVHTLNSMVILLSLNIITHTLFLPLTKHEST